MSQLPRDTYLVSEHQSNTVEGWPAELRSAYRDDEDADGDPGPVPDDEHAAFLEFVRAYVVA